jgi:L-ribulose-5-phosphate 3-epimerase
MNTISFMSANYVARCVGYNMTEGWGQGDKATNDYFQPLETFGQRFEEILTDIRAMGFEAMDLWLAHLHPDWATPDHVATAKLLLSKHNLKVVSLAGGFGNTPELFEKTCKQAAELGTKVLGGGTPLLQSDRAFVVKTLNRYSLKLGIENHPEKTPQELLDKIGDGGNGTIGAAVDTGWFGTQGYDAAKALEELEPYLFHVHLKDVFKVGTPHDTCRFGQGVVPMEKCVQTLQRIGYGGALSVEHEPDHSDPTEDVKASFAMLRGWLQAG